VAKRLELLHELSPGAARVAVLVNPTDRIRTEAVVRDAESAGRTLGMEVYVLGASTIREIDEAFAALRRHGALSYSSARTRSSIAVGFNLPFLPPAMRSLLPMGCAIMLRRAG
jgi:hypothetical protein